MPNHTDSRIINASPTKSFFIDMLVKDIGLIPAIVDLVDNAADGARRVRGTGDYTGLTVRVVISPEQFKIGDNCGGMAVDLARDYAFRFGRPEDMPPTPHSVGKFGVGMKRAIFKLGREFLIESTTETSHFVVEENVDDWKAKDAWEFEFRELQEDLPSISPDKRGTAVTVKSLHESVSEDFALDNFQTRLAKELMEAHLQNMARGLTITLNGVPLQIRPLELLHSDQLKPAYRQLMIGETTESRIEVKMYAGISGSEPSAAGWYVFCNGRLIIGADQSGTTGWGEGGGTTIPKYHNQFARFRGYAFFDSDDPGLLPWNTTKTGVDADSPSFRAVRLEMIRLMRPVIDFLNRLDAENAREETDEKPLETLVNAAIGAGLSDMTYRETFETPKIPPMPPLPRTGRIQYSKPVDQIERVKRTLRVSTLTAVGERTFDYFFETECQD
jgi:hypothetical protein